MKKNNVYIKILSVTLLIIVFAPVLLYLFFQIPFVQSYLTKKTSAIISKQLHTDVTVRHVSYTFLNDIIIRDLYIEDNSEDTLIYIDKLTVRPLKLRIAKNEFRIRKIEINNFKTEIYADSSGYSNFQNFIENIVGEKKEKDDAAKDKHIDFKVDKLIIKNSTISYQKQNNDTTSSGLDYNDIYLSNFNLMFKKVHYVDDSLSLSLKNLSFCDKSGFELNRVSSETLIYSPQQTILDNFLIEMSETNIDFNRIALKYKSIDDFKHFIDNVNLDIQINKSQVSLYDLGYISPKLNGYNQILKMSGDINGTVSNLSAKDLSIKFQDDTHLLTTFNFIGLPNIESTYFDVQIDTLSTSRRDIASIKNAKNPNKQLIELPAELKKLGKISYNAKITGLSNNFTVVGGLKSNLGNVYTDIEIKRDSLKNNIHGIINTNNLQVGHLIDNDKIGAITFNDTIDVNLFKDSTISGNTHGKISQFYFNKYNYRNISIDGDFTKKSFTGNINVNDTNLISNFNGKVSFLEEKPVFDFKLDIDSAQLFKLNFEKNDSNSFIALGVESHLTGLKLDDITGTFNFTKQFIYQKNNEQLVIDTLEISSYVKNYFGGKENKEITLISDFVDGQIRGFFEFASLIDYSKKLLSSYLPSVEKEKESINLTDIISDNTIDDGNFFNFNFDLKNTEQITRFFAPNIFISNNSLIRGSYNSMSKRILAKINSEKIKIKESEISNIEIMSDTKNDTLKVDISCKKVSINKKFFLDSLRLNCAINNDTVGLKINWENKSDSINRGSISSISAFSKDTLNNLSVKINFANDTIFLNNRAWTLTDTKLRLDSNALNIRNFYLHNKKRGQHIGITGIASKNPEHQINIRLQNFDMNELTPFIGNVNIQGRVSGTTGIKNISETPIINSFNVISDLMFNDVKLETLVAKSEYKVDSSKVAVHLFTQKNTNDGSTIKVEDMQDTVKKRFVEVKGDYYVNTKKLNFNVKFHKFLLKAFHPYFENVVDKMGDNTNMQGYINVKGTTEKPLFSGDLSVNRAVFRLKQTQVIYSISGELRTTFDNNFVDIHRTKIVSIGGTGHAELMGRVTHSNFKKMNIDMVFRPDSLMVLDLKDTVSSLYYGKLFASGVVNIKGPPKNLVIDAKIKTERNSIISILLNNRADIKEENSFMTFVEAEDINITDTLNLELEKEVKMQGITLNLNLDIDPMSKFKLIMDETTNEVIYLQADGNLNFMLNQFGDMNLLGTLTIVKGLYNFQLQNIISKKFEVKPGSTITWTGEPTDAILNISTILKMKNVSIFDLVLEEDYRSEKTAVECQIQLTDQLMSPNLKFGIELPKADEKIVSQLNRLEQQDINKQILSLLILGRFQPLPGLTSNDGSSGGNMINASEVISNQLTHWLSEIDESLDVTVGEVSAEEVSAAMSKTMFNDYLTINTEVSTNDKNAQEGTSNIVGDVEVEVKMNKKGTLKSKAFNKSNKTEIYEKGPYSQGAGVFFKRDFNWYLFKNDKKKKKNDKKIE